MKTPVEGKEAITCDEFNLTALSEYQKGLEVALRNAVDEFVRYAASEDASVYLPLEGEVDHPLTFSILVPIGESDNQPSWLFDVEAELMFWIKDIGIGPDHTLDHSDAVRAKSIRDALMRIVEFYDMRLGRIGETA